MKRFQLQYRARSTGQSETLLIQRLSDQDKIESQISLRNLPLKAATPLIQDWIRKTHSDFKFLSQAQAHPIQIEEDLGVRLSLLAATINCLRRLDRIRGVVCTLENMTWEEIFYWYSKCRGGSRHKGLKAFRILFDHV